MSVSSTCLLGFALVFILDVKFRLSLLILHVLIQLFKVWSKSTPVFLQTNRAVASWNCFISAQLIVVLYKRPNSHVGTWSQISISVTMIDTEMFHLWPCSFILYCHRLLTTWFWAQMDTTPLEMEAIIGRTGCHWTEVKGKMGKLPDCKQHTASIELEICLQKCCISA